MTAKTDITFKRKLLHVAVASCFTVLPAFANPTGESVVNGSVSFDRSVPNVLNVTNTPNAIVNWQQFGIQAGEITRFIQQSNNSAILNRVVGQDPSQILGSLLSNGRVFLINPNGIVFGAGSTVDVAGLVASTLKLSNGDFLSGKLNFTGGVGAGGIENAGNISTPAGGNIYLIAPDIKNSGIITSPQGEILLAAGHTVNLLDADAPDVQVTISAPATQAVNLGTLMAQSGKIGLYAALIDQQGVVNADTAIQGANGNIIFKASQNITLATGSLTTASGMAGGVRDGGEIRIIADGTLNMRQGSEVHVDGGVDGGDGGFLELSGKQNISLQGAYTGKARQPGFEGGSLLLDPLDIYICNDFTACGLTSTQSSFIKTLGVASVGSGTPTISVGSGDTNGAQPSGVLYLHTDMNNAGWTNVSLAATNDINIDSVILDGDVPSGGSLTLTAGHFIRVNQSIGSSGSYFDHALTLNANASNGRLFVNAPLYVGSQPFQINAGDTIFVNSAQSPGGGGSVTIRAGNVVQINGSFGSVNNPYDHPLTIQATAGTLDINSKLWLGSQDFALVAGNNIFTDVVFSENNIHGGGSLTFTAGNNITVSNNIGTVGSRFNHDLTLNAGNQISIERNIFLGANTLTLAGGDVIIGSQGSFRLLDVNTLGNMSVTGRDFSVLDGGEGASTTVTVGGDLTASMTGSVLVQARYGGASGSNANALVDANNINISALNLSVLGGTASDSDGQANAELVASNDITLNITGSSITLAGGTVNFNDSDSNASAYALISAGRDLTINATKASIQIRGGDINQTSSTALGIDATAEITGGRNVTINAASVTLTGGTILSSNSDGGSMDAYAKISAGSGDVVISTTGAVSLSGGTAQMNSGSGTADVSALISAGQNIEITSSDLTVTGGTAIGGNSYNEAIADAIITAGSTVRVSTSGYVRLNEGTTSASGDIVSAAARIEASPNTIYLDFTSLTCCGFFVNGVDGAITIGNSGFFTGFSSTFDPAVLNSNLFVTYIPGLPPPVNTAINFYTGETNGSTNLDGLIEGIRYGENEDDNEKPECS